MKSRKIFLFISIGVPTILWGIISYVFYLAIIEEHTYLNQLPVIHRILSLPVWIMIMVMIPPYLVSISLGLILYAEKRFWGEL